MNCLAVCESHSELLVGAAERVTIFSLETLGALYQFEAGGVVWGLASTLFEAHDLTFQCGTHVQNLSQGIEFERAVVGEWPVWTTLKPSKLGLNSPCESEQAAAANRNVATAEKPERKFDTAEERAVHHSPAPTVRVLSCDIF